MEGMRMADILPNDGAEQDDEAFEGIDVLRLVDGLSDDQYGLRAIYLAVWGLQDHGVDRKDLHAISELIQRAEEKLQERHRQADEIRAAWAEHEDAVALRKPGEGYWHRDSRLQDAWKEWQAAMRGYKECEESESDERWKAVTAAGERITQLHARTPLGLAVKLRYLFHELEVSPATQDALVYDKPVTDDLLQDGREELGWDVVQIAERLARQAAGRA